MPRCLKTAVNLFCVVDKSALTARLWLGCLLLWLSACGDGTAPAAKPVPPPAGVKVAQPVQRVVSDGQIVTGRVEAVHSVELRARVGGHVDSVHFKAGQLVKQGELLFVIDPKPYQAQLNNALAVLDVARSKQHLAHQAWQRAEQLRRDKAIATEEWEARRQTLEEADALLKSAEAARYSAQLNREYCEIRAPIAGRISREFVTRGNLLNSGDSTVLATLVSVDPVYVYSELPEPALLQYRRQALQAGQRSGELSGMPVQLQLADETDFSHHGQLDYVAPREDSATGTVTVRGVFANADHLLSPGLFARLRLQATLAAPALLLPERAIAYDQSRRVVWVLTAGDQVEPRAVTLGGREGNLRAIVDGIHAEDWVVIEGLQKLKPNTAIAPEKTVIAAPEAGGQ